MDVATWQGRLERTFTVDGVGGNRLLEVAAAEQAYASFARDNLYGHFVLANSFFVFFLETLALAESTRAEWDQASYQWYTPLLLQQATNFRRLRAASNLFLQGYPLFGYALLRDLKDQAILIAGVGSGITTYRRLWGLEGDRTQSQPLTEADWGPIRKRIEKEEQRVFDFMLRGASGLEDEHRIELESWEKMFHQEVHGSRFTNMKGALWWGNSANPLPTMPTPDVNTAGMYVNRADEIGWMLLRTLPMLQLRPGAFGVEWARRWTILDESFQFLVESLARDGLRVASSIIYFVETKFRFSPQSTSYTEVAPAVP
jgi:hypothetical protein